MNFAHPLALLLLLLLVPVALLYWLRVRVPSRSVGTSLFWQLALTEEKARWRWRRWRLKASVAAQILVVILVTLAAAGPQIPASKKLVLILDNSATMRATDVLPTRMDAAKETARRLVESLRSCDEMAVVAVSPQPIEIQPLTSDHVLLKAAIDSIRATAEAPEIDWAVKLAREIPTLDNDRLKLGLQAQVPPRVILITDACAKQPTKRVQESGVEVLRVGTAAGNLAITGLTARRSMANSARCQVLVQVRNQDDRLAQGSLTIAVGGKSEAPVPFSIVKNGQWQHLFELNLPAAARLTAKIEPDDAYIFDDTAVLDIPVAPVAHRVKLADSERSGLKELLAANRRVELVQDDAAAKVIHVFNGNTPPTLPAGPVLIFTPGACDLWQMGEPVTDPLVMRVDDGSPITAGVRLFDAYLPEARQLQIADSIRGVAKPILWSNAMPLGYAIDRPQGRVVVLAGNLATSNFPLQAAFPQMLAQALDWLAGQPPWKDSVISSLPTHEHDQMGQMGLTSPMSASRALGREDLIGTDIRVPGDIGSDSSALVFQMPWPPLWVVPAVLAAVFLIIESCLYQRRWIS